MWNDVVRTLSVIESEVAAAAAAGTYSTKPNLVFACAWDIWNK